MKQLSNTQEKILDLLKQRGSSYTLDDLAQSLGLSSPSSVHYNIQQLLKKGFLKYDPYNPTNYIVLDQIDNGLTYIPLFDGKAKCGPDGEILQDFFEDNIPVPSKLMNFQVTGNGPNDTQSAVAVRTFNDSMEPVIPRGAIVIVNRQENQYQPNKTFLINSEGEALIKSLFLDQGGRYYILSSFNKNYRPFLTPVDDLTIIGRVKAIIANMDI
jgi:repressor LexA